MNLEIYCMYTTYSNHSHLPMKAFYYRVQSWLFIWYLDNTPEETANQRRQEWLGHEEHLLCPLHHTVAIADACVLDDDMTRAQTQMDLLARNLYQHQQLH